MMHKKRQLHQWKNPFDTYPFEAYLFGSWQAVEFIKIKSGTMTLHFIDNQHLTMDKGPNSDIRIRSRKANLSDCSCLLRPGIDICVLSVSQCSNNSEETSHDLVWVDAKIHSIKRNPHDSECSCQYYVNCYVNQGSLGSKMRTLSKEVKEVKLNQITILQRLEHNTCEDQPYRWSSSEDCSAVQQTKLLVGKFLYDLSCLVVESVLKKVSFCVRSIENKIVYQILDSGAPSSSLNRNSRINVLNFKEINGGTIPVVTQLEEFDTNMICYGHESQEHEVSASYKVEGLRRSYRRSKQPDRYLGCDVSILEVGYIQTRPYKIKRVKDDEKNVPLATVPALRQIHPKEEGDHLSQKTEKCQEPIVHRGKKKTRRGKSSDSIEDKHQTELAIIPLPNEDDLVPLQQDEVTRSNARETGDAEKVVHYSSRQCFSYSNPKLRKKNLVGPDDVEIETKWGGLNFKKGNQERKYGSTYSSSRSIDEVRTYKERTINSSTYTEMINSFLKNMNRMTSAEEPLITDQWKETSDFRKKKKPKNEEMSETDKLWREMDLALTSSRLLEEAEGSNVAANVAQDVEKSNKICHHDERLDEEIGIYCRKCGVVITEIRHVLPPFIEKHTTRHKKEKQCKGETSGAKDNEDYDFNLVSANASRDEPICEENENIWASIPDQLREKMHIHQKNAFLFLWQNIAGSMEPRLMEAESKNRGGCVISHSPGSGKTFLIIAFLASYLKLFPGNKPLVLAPKTTLHTWYKELIKWDFPLPVYLIHDRRSQSDFKSKSICFPGLPKPTGDVKHTLDCLEKIEKWHSHPSVLVMSYNSFLSLIREDSKPGHRKHMAKVLRESPGLMILDEGHNPRSTKSRLRKCLMKVETELRILLSGTLFQNNLCEFFNTLYLARPKFAQEVLHELDPQYRKNPKIAEKARHLLEARARKIFLDNIAKKIDSKNDEERKHGLNVLRSVTNGFVDFFEGGNSELPGLQTYTLLMNTFDMQQDVLLRLHEKMPQCQTYPLGLELLITLGSIHPWLVRTAACADKFLTSERLEELDRLKFDLKGGTKVRFVLSLVHRVVQNEKVLVFCHNIAPIKFLVELFERFFGWQKDREILVLSGELELFERGKVIDEFEEPGGASKILLASITACGEGISLTAASRVIFLDAEWNPSKTKQAIARAFRPGQQRIVYVYQLLAAGSLEEDKYQRTTWKESVSSMIFSEDPSQWHAEKIEDDILREMVEEDRSNIIKMIMKNEKPSTN